jgi:Na+/citrate or Na+/malate symporter
MSNTRELFIKATSRDTDPSK